MSPHTRLAMVLNHGRLSASSCCPPLGRNIMTLRALVRREALLHDMHMCFKGVMCMKNETTYQAVLGRVIAQKRQEKQIDQAQMARYVGVTRSTWSRIEAGSSALSMDQLAKAASKLDVPLGELMLEVDDIVRELRRQDVEVHDSRDQTTTAKVGKAATVAFLGGAVLGGIVAALAAKNTETEQQDDEGKKT